MRELQPVPAPRIDALVLENLFDGDSSLLEPGSDLDALRFAAIRGEMVDISGSTIMGCEFDDAVAGEFSMASARVAETRFRQIAVPSFKMARSVLRGVEFEGGRLGAVEAYDVECKAVHFNGCRLNYLNMRGSRLFDVAFTDCHIDELDLGQAKAQRMRFTGCHIGTLALHDNVFQDVDLRGAELEIVNGAASLKGATVSSGQLMGLAPQLATELGIRVAGNVGE